MSSAKAFTYTFKALEKNVRASIEAEVLAGSTQARALFLELMKPCDMSTRIVLEDLLKQEKDKKGAAKDKKLASYTLEYWLKGKPSPKYRPSVVSKLKGDTTRYFISIGKEQPTSLEYNRKFREIVKAYIVKEKLDIDYNPEPMFDRLFDEVLDK